MITPRLLEPGDAAPDFTLTDQHAQSHSLRTYRGRWVVLYFYPKDSTPGCTKQACDFRDQQENFEKHGAVVLGVSPDAVSSKARFAEKQRLNFPILADPDRQVCEAYGVWQEKKNYGRTYLGVVRTTYLIDPRGHIHHRWSPVRVAGHIEAVRQELERAGA